ncbi:hypothetical protein [Microbacterium sp. 5K110]|uniref:hypothetical protein n=1 Tax=unclassified Microbacterium TaxID=2609290 RepID=UPI0010FE078C|nr:hypothetical protein [Microbacterium sp. 5K110]TLF30910.1 hypothetical protein FE256_09220 [Microbacterium sp. 5K110]
MPRAQFQSLHRTGFNPEAPISTVKTPQPSGAGTIEVDRLSLRVHDATGVADHESRTVAIIHDRLQIDYERSVATRHKRICNYYNVRVFSMSDDDRGFKNQGYWREVKTRGATDSSESDVSMDSVSVAVPRIRSALIGDERASSTNSDRRAGRSDISQHWR